MKSTFPYFVPGKSSRPSLLAIALVSLALADSSRAQATGFSQTGAGPYNYMDTANWVDGNINGIWDAGLAVTAGQIVEFNGSTTLTTGLSFHEADAQNKTLRANGGASTLTLGGDILMNPTGNSTYTIGSTSGAQNLNVDLGGQVRTVTVFGSGNGGSFGRTLNFTNNVSNGGIIASGGGSGGGRIQFNALSISLTSLDIRDAEVSFNGSSNTSANSLYSISGAMTAGGGAATVTVLPKTSATARNATVQADSFDRAPGGTILFRGTGLGTTSIASATGGVANIAFANAPAMLGGGGSAGTSTVSIIAGAFGDTSATGTGFGATAGLVTYDTTNGVRLLSESEYKSSITDGQTQLDNIKLANSSSTVQVTTLTSPVTTINSLSLAVSGSTGNQGITVTGGEGTSLKINSGVIYADQSVLGTNPAASDAMTISTDTLDLNGQEGIILVNTKMNTGGTRVSNGALIINSTIINGTGLTIGDGMAQNAGGYVVLGGSGANTYTGNTTINGAIVQLKKTVANSFGDVVLNLGSLYDTGNQIQDTANVTINGGSFFLNGSNNSGSATNETINNLTMTGGGIGAGSGSGNTFDVLGNASLSGGSIGMARNAKLNISGTTTLNGGAISVGANDSSSVYNSKTTLSGPVVIQNTEQGTGAYTPISIAAGVAVNNLGGQVELSGDLTFIGSANTNTVTIAAPAGTGLRGVLALNGTRTFNIGKGAASVDLTVQAGMIDGTATGGLTKTGAGVLSLTGNNTYTGATTVNAGTLLLDGSSVSAVTVNSGAFGGAGTNLNTVAIGNSGTLAPGNSAGVLSTGDLSFTGVDSTLAAEIGGVGAGLYDQVNVTGLVSLDGNGKIEIDMLSYVPQPSDIFFLVLNDGGDAISGTLNGIVQGGTFTSGGYTWQVSYVGDSATNSFTNGNDLAIQVVPEPSAVLLLAGGLGMLAVARRRR